MIYFSLIILALKSVGALLKMLNVKFEKTETTTGNYFIVGIVELIAYGYIFSYFIQLK